MKDEPILIAFIDLFSNKSTYIIEYTNMLRYNKFKDSVEWWDWMCCEYGAVQIGPTREDSCIRIQFPNRDSYARYCLTWM